jgi:NTP pyrophosphatase (non-canonical NTP hydrolase)
MPDLTSSATRLNPIHNQYSHMVAVLAKPGTQILAELTPHKTDLAHMACGISGEAGEVLELIKKHVFNNKPLDIAKLVLELGDIEFYLEGLRQKAGITREETLQGNFNKLNARYEGLIYSDRAAHARADEAVLV